MASIYLTVAIFLLLLITLPIRTFGSSKAEIEAQKQKASTFLSENAQNSDVITLPSGLQYKILKASSESGPSPSADQSCVVHYEGTTLDGTVFDSSYKRNRPSTFAPSGVIKGWKEILMMMKEGDKYEVWVPSHLGYGDSDKGSIIKGGMLLKFTIELIQVQPKPKTPIEWLRQQFNNGSVMPFVGMYAIVILVSKLWPLLKSFLGQGPKEVPISSLIGKPENVSVYFDISVDDNNLEENKRTQRVTFELFPTLVPKTVENFRALCTGEKGVTKSGNIPLCYKNSKFHRIIPNFMLQGGDFTLGNGRGGESIYGGRFNDEFENGYIAHSQPLLLSMANAGANTNGSQFFITVSTPRWLDKKHVVFGRVSDGAEFVQRLASYGSSSGNVKCNVTIVDCGELKSKST